MSTGHTREYSTKKVVEIIPSQGLLIVRSGQGAKSLKISIATFEMAEAANGLSSIEAEADRRSYEVCAIYGIIQLVEDCYVIVVEEALLVAKILGRGIYRAKSFRFLSLHRKDLMGRSDTKSPPFKDDQLIGLLGSFLNKGYFYFSDEYDLSSDLQSLASKNFSLEKFPHTFRINHAHITMFLKEGLKCFEYVSSFIIGFVEQREFACEGFETAMLTVISRKAGERLGSKYFSRGVDQNGNVSNFAETEAILEVASNDGRRFVSSHVQIRGSIPVYWKQPPTFSFNPEIVLSADDHENAKAFQLHFDKLVERYNRVQCVNLIGKSGSRNTIGQRYLSLHNDAIDRRDNLRGRVFHEWFDFHKESRNNSIHSIHNLLDGFETNLAKFGYFQCEVVGVEDNADPNGMKFRVVKAQEGVVRTNCIDCLDRTNVVQAAVSRSILLKMLSSLSLIKGSGHLRKSLDLNFELCFREAWTNNGNALSILYSGSRALITDFTRRGRMTWRGVLEDTKNTVTRYFTSTYLGLESQVCYDLIQHSFKADAYEICELGTGRRVLKRAILTICLPAMVRLACYAFNQDCSGLLFCTIALLAFLAAYIQVRCNVIRHEAQVFPPPKFGRVKFSPAD